MPETMRSRSWVEEDGRVLRLRMLAPILDRAMVRELHADLAHPPEGTVAVVLDAQGANFSHGASIPEHAPGAIRQALPEFHALVKRQLACPLVAVAVVRGRCLGGGLELALGCDVMFASGDATFGLPEIRLGVFAPVGSLALRSRIGEGAARELLLSGRSIDAEEAARLGLVQGIADDPAEAALKWLSDHVLSSSPSGLAFAVRAARMRHARELLPLLDEVERVYLDELMAGPDPAEGVRAFVEKRAPSWQPREA